MNFSTKQRLGIFSILALVMAATRVNHFGALPDASWAVFFLGGFYLRGSARWAFPLLMTEAVLVDFFVIRSSGMDFWSAYCVSAAYWCLIAAYGAMWLGGSALRRHARGFNLRSLGLAMLALVVAAATCHLIAQGSFYWLSDSVPQPRTVAGWLQNYADWFLPYLRTAAMYTTLAAVLHGLATQLLRALSAQKRGTLR